MSESTPAGAGRGPGQDFIREIIAEDLERGIHTTVVTRFPPEPNGFLHIGHAKAIVLNFGVAAEVAGGRCHLRYDDTNPETEDIRYVESIQRDVRWLGFDWGEHLYYASDYFDRMYGFAEELIGKGLAYVDSSTEEEIREARGTVLEPGRPTRDRDRPIAESLDLFRRMRAGEFANGTHVLRARIDLSSNNMLMRDPLLYRIRHAHHYRTGDSWCIYPLYDYAHPIEDALEHITHSLCTLEFENNREFYDWLLENISAPSRPRQYEFARLNLDYTVMSKRKLLRLAQAGDVAGWDDPRMPTLAGLRRRGFTPASIRSFCTLVGVSKSDSRVDIGKLEYAIRDDLNSLAPRVMAVLRPLRVVITNWPAGQVEEIDAPSFPHDIGKPGSRPVPFSGELYIERDDFMEDPPRGFHRLVPGGEVRLRYGWIIRCDEVVRDTEGGIRELRCSYDPASSGEGSRSVKGTIHWVSAAHALECEVRLYDRLFTVPDPDADAAATEGDVRDLLNPDSLVTIERAWVEPSVHGAPAGTHYQFERLGYFTTDLEDHSDERLVFNRTVTLRDTWSRRVSARPAAAPAPRAAPATSKPKPSAAAQAPLPAPRARERPARSAELDASMARYIEEHGIGEVEAGVLTRDANTAHLFETTLRAGADARVAANWIVNELPRAAEGRSTAALPFDGRDLAELIRLVTEDSISTASGREVLSEMIRTGSAPAVIVELRGLHQVSDASILEPLVDQVIARYPDKVAAYRAGRSGLLGFFMGQVMQKSEGRADPERVKSLLESRLA
jgi:glutaminyl-tRNA synthetase